MSGFAPVGLGWLRDLPDPRDYGPTSDRVARLLGKLAGATRRRAGPPARVDWREFCGPVTDQRPLAASTASACLGLSVYCDRRAFGRSRPRSRLFLHQMARQLEGRNDAGAGIRTTLKALVRFGLPPERLWPYEAKRVDDVPPPMLHAYADYSDAVYFRFDSPAGPRADTLPALRAFLFAGFPCALGFSVPDSIGPGPDIPTPTMLDGILGGHAVTAVGYDDRRRIRSSRGALLVLNSWGTDWGEHGFGWLPYEYVEQGWAADLWTALRPGWLSSGEFARPY